MVIDGTTYDRRFSFSSTYIRVVHYNWCNVSVSSSNIWIYFIPYYLLNCNLLFRQFHPNWCPIHICTCNTGMSIICATCQYGTFGTHSFLHRKIQYLFWSLIWQGLHFVLSIIRSPQISHKMWASVELPRLTIGLNVFVRISRPILRNDSFWKWNFENYFVYHRGNFAYQKTDAW